MKSISRKEFLIGAVVAGAGVTTTLAGCAQGSKGFAPASGQEQAWDYEADVVIVGGGLAGLSASESAIESGADVLVIERMAVACPNGYSVLGVLAFWPEKSKELGWPELSAEEWIGVMSESAPTHARRCYVHGEKPADSHPHVERFCELWPDTAKMLERMGMVFNGFPAETTVVYGQAKKFSDPVICTRAPLDMVYMFPEAYPTILHDFLVAQDSYSELLESDALSLTTDGNGRVNGVILRRADGALKRAHARKAVIVATGAFPGDTPMMARYFGYPYAGRRPSGNPQNDGTGLKMASAVGAAYEYIDLFVLTQATPLGCESGLMLEQYQNGHPLNCPAIVVNDAAQRFMPESRGNQPIAEEMLKQHSGFAWWVSDSTLDNAWLDAAPNVVWADTIEELGKSLGIGGDALAATVKRYNGFVDAGVDDDFDTLLEESTRIEKPPFYAFMLEARPYNTFGGLSIDLDSHVLNADGEKIPGLYAAGTVCPNPAEIDSILYFGDSGPAFAFGMQAGKNAAAENAT